jgi:hypothetical protein
MNFVSREVQPDCGYADASESHHDVIEINESRH